MTTQSSPVITDMKVIPVAGHDSMLLNIGGAHSAYFTRNIVVLTDNAGHTGIGEAPGGEVIYQTLVDAIPMVLGQEVARLNKVVQQVHKGNQAADFDTFGKEVLFPFGFGLSYTTFDIQTIAAQRQSDASSLTIQVTNTGNRPGKEVVQIYVSSPQGKLDQPYQALAAFVKTEEMAAGQTCNVRLSFLLGRYFRIP